MIAATMRPAWRVRGVGLVELMVTMLIGALITAGVISLFNANRQSFRMQDNLSVAQESGSFALEFMARDLRLAGYKSPTPDIPGIDWQQSLNDIVQGAFTDDRLAVVHAADGYVGTFTCNGINANPAIPPAPNVVISNVYWVQNSPDGSERELVCQGFRVTVDGNLQVNSSIPLGVPQTMISGVDTFQVLYGVDTVHDNDPNFAGCAQSPDLATEWVTGAQLKQAIDRGLLPPPGCAAMDVRTVIRAVRIGLLVRTNADVDAPPAAGQTYTVLDRTLDQANFPAINDGRIRRLFMTTVALRNAEGEAE